MVCSNFSGQGYGYEYHSSVSAGLAGFPSEAEKLYYTRLCYTILYYTILYFYTILYYTMLYYTILYCTMLYYKDQGPGIVGTG